MNGFNWGLPPNISTYGGDVDSMMTTLHWFMLGLFLFWGVFFVYCLVKFRARAGHKATYDPIHATWSKYLEVGVAIFEAVILIAFSMPVWARFKHDFPKPENSTQVRIIAQQFAWNFWLPGPDGKFGKNSIENMSGGNAVGLDDNDPDGKDDIVTTNNFYFPNDKAVYAWLSSKDVIHSFGVPAIRIRQDAIPGMNIPIWFQVLPGTTGEYDVACSQLCGNGHGKMRGVLHPLPPAEYATWLKTKEDDKNPPPATPAPTATPAASAAPTAKPAASTAPSAKPAASTNPGTTR